MSSPSLPLAHRVSRVLLSVLLLGAVALLGRLAVDSGLTAALLDRGTGFADGMRQWWSSM
jgi:hypothetical protein